MNALDWMIAEAVAEARLENGEHHRRVLSMAQSPAELLLVRGAILRGAAPPHGRLRQPSWSSEELAFLDANAATMSVQQIAEALGRSENSIKVKRTRRGLPAVTRNPELLSARDVALALGVSCSKTINRWVERGHLKPQEVVLNCGWLLIPYERVLRFAVNPDHWVLFDPERVTDEHIARLIALRRARWGDAWLTTPEAADWYNTHNPRRPAVDGTDIHRMIHTGHAPGVQPGMPGSAWYVKRSAVAGIVVPKGQKGIRKVGDGALPDAAWEYLLLGQALGISKTYLGANTGYYAGSIYSKLYGAQRGGYAQQMISRRRLEIELRQNGRHLVMYADWSRYTRRFPALARAMTRFLRHEPLSKTQRDLVTGWLYAFVVWHADRDPAQQRCRRQLRFWRQRGPTAAVLYEFRQTLLGWFAADAAETLPLRHEVLETLC